MRGIFVFGTHSTVSRRYSGLCPNVGMITDARIIFCHSLFCKHFLYPDNTVLAFRTKRYASASGIGLIFYKDKFLHYYRDRTHKGDFSKDVAMPFPSRNSPAGTPTTRWIFRVHVVLDGVTDKNIARLHQVARNPWRMSMSLVFSTLLQMFRCCGNSSRKNSADSH